jgi:lactoylglutathione lyase
LQSTETCPDIATRCHSKGLLELHHIPADSSTPYASGNDYPGPGIGLGHIGFSVPDVAEAVERVKGFGYEVIKPWDEANDEQMGLPEDALSGKYGKISEAFRHSFRQIALVKDPDVSGC